MHQKEIGCLHLLQKRECQLATGQLATGQLATGCQVIIKNS